MAPEQASGSLRKIDARADLYSLGVVLYELLTGELPFGGDAPAILHQAVHARPRPLRRVNRQIPRRLERIVLKCLAKEPDRRYATASELADDLRRWLDCPATPPRPGQGSRRTGHWRRRLLPFAGLATAVGTALLLVPVVTPVALWGTTRGEEPTIGAEISGARFHRARQVENVPHNQYATVVDSPTPSQPPSQSLASAKPIDDFEGHLGAWAAFRDGPTDTLLTLERDSAIRHGGDSSLAIRYDVGPGNWATGSLVHERPQDWSSFQGLRLYLHAERVGQPVVIVAYGGTSPEGLVHYEYSLKAGPAALAGWQRVDVPWHELITPDWQGDRRLAFDPRESMGMAFAFDGPERGRRAGRIWVDDVTLLRSERQAGDGLGPPPARAAISAPLPPKG